MAIAPSATKPVPRADPNAHPDAPAKVRRARILHAEIMIDAALRGRDLTVAQSATIPAGLNLDDSESAELVAHYTKAGWASATVKDGALHLEPKT